MGVPQYLAALCLPQNLGSLERAAFRHIERIRDIELIGSVSQVHLGNLELLLSQVDLSVR